MITNQQQNRVLIVDDDAVSLVFAESVLINSGFQVITASEGEEGIKKAQTLKPDIILLDVQMSPGISGFDTCRRLKMSEETINIPVIFMTVSDHLEDKIQGFEVGGVDYIIKPIEIQETVARLNTHLTLHKLQDADQQNKRLKKEIVKRRQVEEELRQSNCKLHETTKALEASRASFKNVVDKNASGIMVVDENAIIQFMNPAMQKQFCEYQLSVGEEFGLPLNPGKRTEVRVTIPENGIGTAEMDVINTLWENKPAYLLMLHDITGIKKAQNALEAERALLAQRVEERTTDLRQANAELARAVRLKDEFLANMSHELRTPLNAVIMFSDILLDNLHGSLNEKQQKAVRHISVAGKHLLSLINDLLDLSKIEAGQMALEMRTVQIDTLCQESLQFVRTIAKKKHIKLFRMTDGFVKSLQGDERGLKQILVNLLTNAIKFTPEGGEVRLEIEGDEVKRVAQLSVTDTGIGVPENEMKYLFQPFVQLDGGLSRKQEGTGLGLSLVDKLTKLHGGSVNVESELGKGSRFTVLLPWKANFV